MGRQNQKGKGISKKTHCRFCGIVLLKFFCKAGVFVYNVEGSPELRASRRCLVVSIAT